jgi:hypothetical protein
LLVLFLIVVVCVCCYWCGDAVAST